MVFYSIRTILGNSLAVIKKNIYPLLILAIIFSVLIILAVSLQRFAAASQRPYMSMLAVLLTNIIELAAFMSSCSFILDLCRTGKAHLKRLLPNPAHCINYI
ncbi:MAG: hypothetical protein LBU09_02125, partial [Endomicrobium sp.]|nr:hypothetical protein [Endomicrobium sp.]